MTKKLDHQDAKVVTLSLRLPRREYDALVEYQHQNPHLSLNAIIVESVVRLIVKKPE